MCSRIQEMLVAEEVLSAEESGHLSACPDCRRLAETHRTLLAEGALLDGCELAAGCAGPATARARTPGRSRLAWALALPVAAGLALAVFLRPAAEDRRVAEGLGALLEEVYQATDISYEETEDEMTGTGWLTSKGADASADQYGWL